MRLNSLGFLLSEAFAGLVRHRLMTLAAISTSAISFTVMGSFLALLFALNAMSSSMLSDLGVAVYMKPNTDRTDTLNTREAISEMPGVASVIIVTKEDAWSRIKRDLGSNVPLEGVKDNPLTDELHVRLVDVDHVAAVSQAAARLNGVDQSKIMSDVVRNVQATVKLLKQLGIAAACLLMIATLAVIANVIRLTVFARRREIHIMQMVGATNGFIRLPFLLEGIIYGVGGAAVAGAIVFHGGQSVLRLIHSTLPFLPINDSVVPANALAIALISSGALVGLLGSAASVRKFLLS
ncbi:MAG TPA: permease-like cell division protein FtsX [Armatimonadota bacterium]|jgi:cell division transport system permease protein